MAEWVLNGTGQMRASIVATDEILAITAFVCLVVGLICVGGGCLLGAKAIWNRWTAVSAAVRFDTVTLRQSTRPSRGGSPISLKGA